MRVAVASVLGEAKARFFFERFLHYFITEDDLRFIKDLGCTVVRGGWTFPPRMNNIPGLTAHNTRSALASSRR
jgi:hypothetical protein